MVMNFNKYDELVRHVSYLEIYSLHSTYYIYIYIYIFSYILQKRFIQSAV